VITRQLQYFVEKAFQNIRQFLLINFITIGIISLSLIVLSTFLLVFLNLRAHVDTWENQIQVTAYLNDTITEDELARAKQAITELTGVKETEYTSKREALNYLKQAFPDQAAALAGLKENPLPASVDIHLKENFHALEQIESIAAKVERIDGVEEVEYGRSWLERYAGFLRLVKAAALAVGTVIVLATIFIISNTIKLTVYARKEEIEIMRLVGATNAFIRTPFFIEGMLQGLLGALVALGVLAACSYLFTHWLAQSSLLPFQRLGLFFLPLHYTLCIIGGGMLTGLLGSFFSLGRYLRI
jgi:cell division transport system permease protein